MGVVLYLLELDAREVLPGTGDVAQPTISCSASLRQNVSQQAILKGVQRRPLLHHAFTDNGASKIVSLDPCTHCTLGRHKCNIGALCWGVIVKLLRREDLHCQSVSASIENHLYHRRLGMSLVGQDHEKGLAKSEAVEALA